MKEPEINCAHDELRDVVNMTAHPRNPNTHNEEQIRLLAKIIKHQGWRNPIVVSKRSGFIVAGHGRLMAAEQLGLEQVPVDLQDFKTEADELAHLVADNRIAELAEIDRSSLADIIGELDTGDYDLDMTGFEVADLEELMSAAHPDEDKYTAKIEAPIYEIKGDKPDISELVNKIDTSYLEREIQASKTVSKKEKAFLIDAAQRHNIFNYEKIAEFYAHSSDEMKTLMEMSALVIIDFDKAIENGFVEMSQSLAEISKRDLRHD